MIEHTDLVSMLFHWAVNLPKRVKCYGDFMMSVIKYLSFESLVKIRLTQEMPREHIAMALTWHAKRS
jgi:hypothetical protein